MRHPSYILFVHTFFHFQVEEEINVIARVHERMMPFPNDIMTYSLSTGSISTFDTFNHCIFHQGSRMVATHLKKYPIASLLFLGPSFQ